MRPLAITLDVKLFGQEFSGKRNLLAAIVQVLDERGWICHDDVTKAALQYFRMCQFHFKRSITSRKLTRKVIMREDDGGRLIHISTIFPDMLHRVRDVGPEQTDCILMAIDPRRYFMTPIEMGCNYTQAAWPESGDLGLLDDILDLQVQAEGIPYSDSCRTPFGLVFTSAGRTSPIASPGTATVLSPELELVLAALRHRFRNHHVFVDSTQNLSAEGTDGEDVQLVATAALVDWIAGLRKQSTG